jgi:hypothetical protein
MGNAMNTSPAIPADTPPSRTRVSVETAFALTAGAILGVTGVAKIATAFESAPRMASTDPIFGIPFRYLMLTAGMAEVVIAGVCFFRRTRRMTPVFVASLATSVVVYRLGQWWLDWTGPCGCLGNLTHVLYLSPRTVDQILKGILVYLLVGSYWLIVGKSVHSCERACQ